MRCLFTLGLFFFLFIAFFVSSPVFVCPPGALLFKYMWEGRKGRESTGFGLSRGLLVCSSPAVRPQRCRCLLTPPPAEEGLWVGAMSSSLRLDRRRQEIAIFF